MLQLEPGRALVSVDQPLVAERLPLPFMILRVKYLSMMEETALQVLHVMVYKLARVHATMEQAMNLIIVEQRYVYQAEQELLEQPIVVVIMRLTTFRLAATQY
jgi:hypothetical protein